MLKEDMVDFEIDFKDEVGAQYDEISGVLSEGMGVFLLPEIHKVEHSGEWGSYNSTNPVFVLYVGVNDMDQAEKLINKILVARQHRRRLKVAALFRPHDGMDQQPIDHLQGAALQIFVRTVRQIPRMKRRDRLPATAGEDCTRLPRRHNTARPDHARSVE